MGHPSLKIVKLTKLTILNDEFCHFCEFEWVSPYAWRGNADWRRPRKLSS